MNLTPTLLGVFSLCLSAAAPVALAQVQDPIPEKIPHGPQRIQLQRVVEKLVAPHLLIPAPGDKDRLFIADQNGQVWILQNGQLLAEPFLDLANLLVKLNRTYDERGLLGLAFHPGFADPDTPGYGRLFTYSSEPVKGEATFRAPNAKTLDHHSVVAAWKVDPNNPNKVDMNSRVELMRIEQPQMNHNGGMLLFGPDGYLFIALGDGGGANDNNPNGHNPEMGNGQDMNTVLGKILRIDVNGNNSANGQYGIPADNPFLSGDTPKEIYATGFRNPWRIAFDGKHLIAGDVGQGKIEEIDLVEKGKNYGWRLKEGTFRFNPADGSVSQDTSGLPADLVDPVAQYDHDEGISITGGYVYRGKAIPELEGKYVFADYSTSFTQPKGRLFYTDLGKGEIREFILAPDDQPLGYFVKGFGIDREGELYVMASKFQGLTGPDGVVFKIVPATPAP